MAIGNVDAHVAVPAMGVTNPGKMVMIMGTSTCSMFGTKEEDCSRNVWVCEDGIIPGLLGYEAGQSCVGDIFEWFANNCVPETMLTKEAEDRGMDIHQYLNSLQKKLKIFLLVKVGLVSTRLVEW